MKWKTGGMGKAALRKNQTMVTGVMDLRRVDGFFGEIKRPDGNVSTELSVGFEIDGKEVLMPAMVPTLTKKELDHLISGGEMTDEIADKAYKHGLERMKAKKSTFIEEGEKVTPLPKK
jgi:hypothetical protein